MDLPEFGMASSTRFSEHMLKHLCSAISYGGAQSLQELREKFWSHPGQYLVKLTAASRAESFQR